MKTCFSKLCLAVVLLCVLGSLAPVRMMAQTFTNLHTFTVPTGAGTNYDGAEPKAGVIISGETVYGSAQYGGVFGSGTLFAVNIQTTNFATLHSFALSAVLPGVAVTNGDGMDPSMLMLSGSTLYGTASQGGLYGSGAIFAIQTNGTGFTNFYNFTGTALNNNGVYTNHDGVAPNTR